LNISKPKFQMKDSPARTGTTSTIISPRTSTVFVLLASTSTRRAGTSTGTSAGASTSTGTDNVLY
jgi:hypothetical protein